MFSWAKGPSFFGKNEFMTDSIQDLKQIIVAKLYSMYCIKILNKKFSH